MRRTFRLNLGRRMVGSAMLALSTMWNPPNSAAQADFPVGPGDDLQVVVFGEENVSAVLSGRFGVDADGSLNYPLVGELEVAGLSPTEVAELLGQSLSQLVRVSPPTVTVAEYAPVFIVGDVVRSGPIEFQPEMTVFRLVLLAGGLSEAGGSERERLSLLQELAALKLSAFSLKVQKARILAELQGRDFDGSALKKEAAELDAASIIMAETAVYDARQRARASQRGILEAQIDGYDQEISSIQSSIGLHDQEVQLLEEQLEVQADLAERGLAAQSVRREAQRQLTVSRREALEFRTALFRAKQGRIAARQAFSEAEARREEENVRALREVEVALGQNEISLNAVKSRFAQFAATQNAAQDALGRVPQYLLTRVVKGKHASRPVDAFTRLERGDIITVRFDTGEEAMPPPARQAQAASPSTD